MLNIADLEKRWIRYKIKSYIPHFIIFISLILITSIFLTFSSVTQNVKHVSKTIPSIPTSQIVKEIVPVETEKAIIKVVAKEIVKEQAIITPLVKKIQLSPSLDFMRKMQNSVQPDYNNESSSQSSIVPRIQNVKKVQAPKIEVLTQKKVIVTEYTPIVEAKKVIIKRQNTQNDIYEIITRFKKNNNPALSLFVAKKYYELNNYQQAYNYALITNKINPNIESSWIIFTKSLVKLGKRNQAIKTLKKYIKQSYSSSAQILLDEIYAGKFK